MTTPRFYRIDSRLMSIAEHLSRSSKAPVVLVDMHHDSSQIKNEAKEGYRDWPSASEMLERVIADGKGFIMEMSYADAVQECDAGAGWIVVRTGSDEHYESLRRGKHYDELNDLQQKVFDLLVKRERMEVEHA